MRSLSHPASGMQLQSRVGGAFSIIDIIHLGDDRTRGRCFPSVS